MRCGPPCVLNPKVAVRIFLSTLLPFLLLKNKKFGSTPEMNPIRLLADFSHLASILIILLKMHKSRSCAGNETYPFFFLLSSTRDLSDFHGESCLLYWHWPCNDAPKREPAEEALLTWRRKGKIPHMNRRKIKRTCCWRIPSP